MRYNIELVRTILFNLGKEKDTTDVTHLKSVDFEKESQNLHALINVLKTNIGKKVTGYETIYTGTKDADKAAIEVIKDRTFRGRKPTSYVNKIIDSSKKKMYEEALSCTNIENFKKECARLANDCAEKLIYPKGIICFVQFTFQLSRKNIEKFLAILTTDYDSTIMSFDTTKGVLEYLERAFGDDFHSTIIYPHIVKEEIPKINRKETKEQEIKLVTDKDHLKIHMKSNKDSNLYSFAGTKKPIDSQEEFIKLYEKQLPNIVSIEDLPDLDKEGHINRAKYTLKLGDNIKIDVNANEFNKLKLVHSDYGQGFIVKDTELEVLLGKHNVFKEGKVKFHSPEELIKSANRKGDKEDK